MPTSDTSQDDASVVRQVDVAIIGGGIAGMYCAHQLRTSALAKTSNPVSIGLFEATDRLGGRICTRTVVNDRDEPEFFAEFGPMRIEPAHQALLAELLNELDIRAPQGGDPAGRREGSLVTLSSAGLTLAESKYAFQPQEGHALPSAAALLLRALVEILKSQPSQGRAGADRFHAVIEALRVTLTVPPDAEPSWRQRAFGIWAKDLDDADLQSIRECAELNGVPLWQMGFWNLLSEMLPHEEVNAIRDRGAFFHLIHENPNAADWLIACLRWLKTSKKLQAVHGGMEIIVNRLQKRFTNIECRLRHTLVELTPRGENVLLKFSYPGGFAFWQARHVILALPKARLQKLMRMNDRRFPDRIQRAADSVIGYPMLKAFFAVKARWWPDDYRAEDHADRLPTRELHVFNSLVRGSRRGMILIYTDRPGSEFWSDYIGTHGRQDEPELFARSALRTGSVLANDNADNQRRRLIKKFLQYAKRIGGDGLSEEDIEWCGIRDWGREPYCGANHVWRPQRKSWEELKELSAFALDDGENKNIHVCGEAYCDYQGFIEGSLRSAAHVLHAIDRKFETKTFWLCDCVKCRKAAHHLGLIRTDQHRQQSR